MARALGHRERARRVSQLAAQRQLAEHRIPLQRARRDLAARGQYPERERGVEARTDLAQERGCEVRGDPRLRKLEARVHDRRANPVARFAHRGVAEADDREGRQPAADVDLDPHLARIDAVDGEGGDTREHAVTVRGGLSQVGHGMFQFCASCAPAPAQN